MKKHNRVAIFSVLMLVCTSCIFYFSYTSSTQAEIQRITQSLKLAAVAIDTPKVREVNSLIVAKENKLAILNNKSYKALVATLDKITSNMPMDALWSYLVYPASEYELSNLDPNWKDNPEKYSREYTILSVLTVDKDINNPNTLPGVLFDMTDFPAMIDAVNGSDNITVSEIVYDGVYDTWNRGGFIRIYDEYGNFVAVLGVEIELKHEINIILNSLIFSVAYSVLLSIFLTLVLIRYYAIKEEENNG